MSQPTNGTTDHSLADITDSQLMQDEDDSKDDILENNDAADESDPDDQGDESEDDEETEEEDEDEDDESESEQESQATLNTMPRSPNSTPTCYICLNEFDGQDIGSPDSCENIHYFCHECIEEWSKQVNTCPVDRKTFSLILVRRVIGGEIIMKVPVIKESVIENNDAMIDDVTYCEICGRCDREDRLLLCDGCDFGYHCECLTPPLETIPVDEWFCPECFHRLFGDELQQETPRPTTQRRAIARTGAFEIVRNRIIMRRTGNSQSTTQRATTRKTRKRKRKTTRRRKTRRVGKKRTTKGKSSRRRKRTKRSKMSTRRLPSANTTRSRLATRLGIGCKPKTPYALPTMKPPTNVSSISESRYSAGINNLSMFGYELGLHNPRSYDELDEPNTFDLSGEVGLLTIPRNPLRSIGVKPTIKDVEHSSDPFLLENILNSQQILHAPSCDLIVRDGKVLLKTDAKSVRKCPDSSPTSPSGASPSNEAKGTGSSSDTIYKQDSSLSSTAPNLTDAADSNDISFIKPSPVVALPDDKPDIELYSDIESVGDNKDNEEGEDVKSKNFKKENGSDQRTSNGIASEPADKVAQASDVPSSPPPTIPCNSTNGPTTKDEAELPPDPSDEKSSKRRPSIRDLFGGDSEDDEEEDDLKRLVAEKGSINRHYPIKMPILYKNKFLEDKKNLAEVNEVPISKKWIPIYPETDTVKSSGPKWKAVGTTESEKKGSKWDAKEKQTSDLKKKTLVAEIQNNLDRIEDDLMESLKKNLDESSKQEEAMSSDNEDRLVIQADSPASIELIKEVRPPPRPDNDKKVRICRHGRPIHRDKDKDRRHEEDSNRHNSNPSKRFKDEHRPTETSRTVRVVESDLRDDYDLRKSSRTRSHRDEKKEKSSERVYSKVVNCSKNHSRDSRERRHRSRDRSRELSHNRSHDWSRDRSRDRDHYRHREESHTRSSKRYREDSRNDRRSRRHSERNERSMSREGDRQRNGTKGWKSGKRRRRHHRRRHRHRTESSPQQVSPEHHKRRDPSPEHTLSKDSAKPLISTSQTFSVIKPNSKEIYAQGDQIFINVNFGDADLSKNNNGARTEENGNNKTKSEKSNVDILSPQSGISIAKSEASIASPNDTDNSGAEKAKIGKLSNSESLKVLSEEFKFLPRIMQSIEPKSVSVTHPTDSPVYDDDDSFMPTPTQDESQSPIRNHLNNLKKAKLVSSKSSNKLLDIENDFYDPELPLSSSNESDKSDQSPLSLHKEKHQSTLAKLTPAACELLQAATQSLGKMNNNKFGDIDLRKIALNFKLPSNLSKLSGHSSKHVNKPSTSSNQLVDPTRDVHDIIDMELESPSPSSSPNDDNLATLSSVKEKWEKLVKEGRLTDPIGKKINNGCDSKRSRIDASRIDEPLSAVDLQIQQKYIKKLNRQERVVEEVKISLKPFYQKKRITKEEYKDILRKCVPKICHSKSGEINPVKISNMVKAYIKRYRYLRKKKA